MPSDQGGEDILLVREAARVAGVPSRRVHTWIGRGLLVAQPTRHGKLVSLAAVRALTDATRQPPPAPREPREIPGDDAAYVLPYVAARQVGVSPDRVLYWGKTGRVASRPSRHGRLVRLADVHANAAQVRGATRAAPQDTEAGE